jgi:hypothetical protein
MGSYDTDLDGVVRDAIARARALGLDAASAARRAAQAVRTARSDLTPDEARALVEISAPPSPRGRVA